MELNKIIKKVLRESIIETELGHTPENRKLKLIQNYLDNVLVPGNDLICKAEIHIHSSRDQYFVTLWVDTKRPLTVDEYDNLVDNTWDEIYNMFEIGVSVRRVKSEC
jgi:hypothetical protein